MAIRVPALASALKGAHTGCAVWLLLTGLPAGCTSSPDSPAAELEACRVADLPTAARCGRLSVQEQAGNSQSRALSLRFAVIPAVVSTPHPDPLLIVVGGPGQAATEAGGAVAAVLSDVRRTRDIVLVDQRGTGGSNALDCADDDVPFVERFNRSLTEEDVRSCLAAQEADLTLYTTWTALHDLEAVRTHLGYSAWNVWGGSYGTRVALAYMQRYPDAIRRVILDGAAPTDLKLPLHFSADAERSWRLAVQACQKQPSCQAAFPELEAELQRLLVRLTENPLTVAVAHPNAGTPERLLVSRLGFTAGVRSLLYSADLTALLPLALTQAARHDNWAPFVTAVTALTESMDDRPSYTGMYLSVVCSEDVARITDDEVASHSAGFFGREFVDQLKRACALWPKADLPASYFDPVTAAHPTLVLSGELDPATPPRFGELVTRRLPQAQHVIVPAVSHGVSSRGCVPELIAHFLDAAEPATLDTTCAQESARPAFFTRLTGP